jgi:hypothetical protein
MREKGAPGCFRARADSWLPGGTIGVEKSEEEKEEEGPTWLSNFSSILEAMDSCKHGQDSSNHLKSIQFSSIWIKPIFNCSWHH